MLTEITSCFCQIVWLKWWTATWHQNVIWLFQVSYILYLLWNNVDCHQTILILFSFSAKRISCQKHSPSRIDKVTSRKQGMGHLFIYWLNKKKSMVHLRNINDIHIIFYIHKIHFYHQLKSIFAIISDILSKCTEVN